MRDRPSRVLDRSGAAAGLALAALGACLAPARPEAARAAPPPPPGLALSDGRILLLPGSPALGFFTVTNRSDQAVLVTGWSSPACGTLQFEEAGATSGGVSRLTVPAGNRLSFAPGGYHLTCWQPTAALRPGVTVPVTLAFGGASLTVPFAVRTGTPAISR